MPLPDDVLPFFDLAFGDIRRQIVNLLLSQIGEKGHPSNQILVAQHCH